jgi:hypothetical protein
MVGLEGNGIASDQEAAVRHLECGDGAMGLGKLGLEVGENLGLRWSRAGGYWPIQGRPAIQESGANGALMA